MTQSNRASLEAWLRFADDLGLGPFFLERAPQLIPVAKEVSASQGPAISSPGISGGPLSGADSGPHGGRSADPGASAPTGAFTSEVSERPASQAFSPQATGITLFEERIENDSLERIRADIGP